MSEENDKEVFGFNKNALKIHNINESLVLAKDFEFFFWPVLEVFSFLLISSVQNNDHGLESLAYPLKETNTLYSGYQIKKHWSI